MGLELYYSGFIDLTSTRSVGFSLGPISLLMMIDYCEAVEIYGEQREDFLWLVTRLDAKYLEWSANRAKPV